MLQEHYIRQQNEVLYSHVVQFGQGNNLCIPYLLVTTILWVLKTPYSLSFCSLPVGTFLLQTVMANDQGEKFHLLTNAVEAHLYTYFVDIISLTPHFRQHLPTSYFEPVFSVAQLETSCSLHKIEQLYLHIRG